MAADDSVDPDGGPLRDDELAGWLRLTQTPGVGPATCRTLLAAFGLPDAIFGMPRSRLLERVSPTIADALQAPVCDALRRLIDLTCAWRRETRSHIVTLADTRYPPALLETVDPPPMLYVRGRIDLLARPSLAIVGSRNATPQGLVDARRFAGSLARAGYTVVSGLALGIDAAAHEGALAAGPDHGSTIAIMGTGADVIYPSSHRALAHRIATDGAIVSELPLGTTASAHQFPRRNRIIAGLARGTLVVEAAARSGSLITARLASECGREVFAMPGSIHSPLAKGCHQLIRQGAKLVESIDDIVDELGGPAPAIAAGVRDVASPSRATGGDDDRLVALLGFDPVSADELAERCGWAPSRLAARLLDLELSGRLARLPGGRVQRLVV